MDLTKYRQKLIGSEDERAVSPVIGVILMVAITVILAAVIAAFVLDMGDSIGQEAQAGVTIDVDDDAETVTVEITSSGNADDFKTGGTSAGTKDDQLQTAGDVITLNKGAELNNEDQGTVTVIGVIDSDGTETTVGSADYDFS